MIPNLFRKLPLPGIVPQEISHFIDKHKDINNKEKFLKATFGYVVKKGKGSGLNLFLKFNKLFQNNIDSICNNSGYMHCTTMNYLIRIILINNGLFTEADITLKLTHVSFLVPHQYLAVKITNEKFVDVDPWAYQFGVDFGSHAHGFKASTLRTRR